MNPSPECRPAIGYLIRYLLRAKLAVPIEAAAE
jgi:hypothetical protein